mgnify:CR=1 FL=1
MGEVSCWWAPRSVLEQRGGWVEAHVDVVRAAQGVDLCSSVDDSARDEDLRLRRHRCGGGVREPASERWRERRSLGAMGGVCEEGGGGQEDKDSGGARKGGRNVDKVTGRRPQVRFAPGFSEDAF